MNEEIIIEKALAEEWEPAMELAWKTFLKFESKEYGKQGTDSFLNFISDEKLFKMFLNGDYKLYVAKEKEKLVGLAGVRCRNHLSLLFVDEDYHKRGIGRKLVSFAQNSMDIKNSVRMTVNAAPYAIGFYEHIGFINSDGMQKADGITFQPMECVTRIDCF